MEGIPGMKSKSYTILIHILVWVAFLLVPLIFIESATGRERFMLMGWFQQLLMAAYFYYNFLYLIPRFLLKKKIGWYFLMLLLGLVAISGINVLFAISTSSLIEHHHPFNFWRTVFFPFYPAVMAFALSSSVRITMEWFKNERQKKEMEAEKLASELAFLKSQVNPHFLFNILNNICSLARKKSDETENAIIKLSQIMRYMLQDSKDEKVSLEKEVEYLQSYIELQRLRLPEMVKIDFSTGGRTELFSIEPLLLIPFVENAFKHGVSYLEPSEIDIRLICGGQALSFMVENRIAKHQGDTAEQGSGIGLKNVVRRLELLYPGKHHLQIRDDGNLYKVELEIKF
ncbi:MAG: histidine kinase [Bacteroidetes bacterium]|nr:histidine kinase [Bacteroidota bacterium]